MKSLAAFLVAALAAAAGLASCTTGFTSDDFFILARVKALGLSDWTAYFRSLEFFEYYRPLTFLTHAIDFRFWGLNAAGFHATNVALHAANAALVCVITRRIADARSAVIAGALFAIHPANHETVYWISARFDLLASFFSLLCIAVWTSRSRMYLLAPLLFGAAMLSKESAVALPAILAGYDVLVARRRAGEVIRRMWPFAVMAVIYLFLRSAGGSLAATGGAARLPKIAMLVMVIGGLLAVAGAPLERGLAWCRSRGNRAAAVAIVLSAVAIIALLFVPAVSDAIAARVGFGAFAAWFSVSPVALPPPPPDWFDRPNAAIAATEVLLLAVALLGLWTARRWLLDRPAALFALLLSGAALIPVSSMTMSARYLYLALAGIAMVAGMAASFWWTRRPRIVLATVTIVAVIAATQLTMAARAWQWASTMTADAIDLMVTSQPVCGTRGVALLTTPVAIRGVYSNLNEVAFDVVGDCRPAWYSTLLRVVRHDTHVEVRRVDTGIEMRVPAYRGNIVASSDLRHFDVPIPRGATLRLETPLGRLDTEPDGDTQVFRLAPASRLLDALLFYYSDGRLRPF